MTKREQNKDKQKFNIKDFVPIASRIIVERIDYTDMFGLYVPDSAKDGSMESLRGKVVSKGDEADLVNVGDIIVYGKYAGTKFSLGPVKSKNDEPTYLMMNDIDVLCTIKQEDKK